MSLKETLANMKEAEEQRKQSELDKPALIQEWRESVVKLYETIERDLAEYKTMGMSFSRETINLSEDTLGQYAIEVLNIKAPGRTITLRPVGRQIIGGAGRIDMHVRGKAFGNETSRLIRRITKSPNESDWIISSPPAPTDQNRVLRLGPYSFMPLEKDTLEGAIDQLLK